MGQKTSVDHGYAWVVLGSCIVMRLLVDGFWSTLGILMLQWQNHLEVGPSKIAWIGSSFMFILLASAPIASALAHRLTYRVVIIGAGLLILVCLFSLSVVDNFWQIYAITSVLGFGLGLPYQASLIYFVYYFDKRYALANGLASAASGIGFFIFPTLMETLCTFYGLRGALQLTSAILANICVCGALLRPSTFEKSDRPKKSIEMQSCPERRCSTTQRRNTSFLKEMTKDFDLTLFRSVRFIFHAILNGFFYGGIYCTLVYFAPYSVSIGIPELKSSFLMSAIGVCICITRLSPLVGYLVDKKVFSPSSLTAATYFICGISIIVTPFTTTYTGLMVLAVLIGSSVGISGALIMVIVTSSADSKAKAPGATGWFILLCGIGSLVGILLTGFLNETTGNFQAPLILCGACTLCMTCIVLADPLLKRWQRRLDERRKLTRTTSEYIYASLEDVTKEDSV